MAIDPAAPAAPAPPVTDPEPGRERTARLVARRFEAWGFVPHLVRRLFADPTPHGVAAAFGAFCERALHAPIAAPEFFDASVGAVLGARLADDRRVVVKVHGPRTSVRYLEAMQAVQRALAQAGFPAPTPLAPPQPLAAGIAVAETLLDTGERADGHDPAVRRTMARELARLVALCRGVDGLDGLRENPMATDPADLWPRPHDDRFAFAATTPGAEWIDAIARRARTARDRDAGDVVVGHTDWRVQHLRFADGELTAVYDWDSLAIQREPVLAGGVAHLFAADWEVGDVRFPTLGEALGFIADYEAGRRAAFDAEQRAVARAALLYAMAYTARCEHSDALTDFGRRAADLTHAHDAAPAGSARAFVAAHAETLLRPGA
jgi:hypothetical protein